MFFCSGLSCAVCFCEISQNPAITLLTPPINVVYSIYKCMKEDEIVKFQWDKGNQDKNLKHGVENEEIEQTFFDKDKAIAQDVTHSQNEKRFIIIGKTKEGRILYSVFTYRGNYIRIISSRDINKKEVQLYEKAG